MDPLTAALNLITALTNLVGTVTQGQTPEQRAIMWQWYITDVERWRKLLKLDPPTP